MTSPAVKLKEVTMYSIAKEDYGPVLQYEPEVIPLGEKCLVVGCGNRVFKGATKKGTIKIYQFCTPHRSKQAQLPYIKKYGYRWINKDGYVMIRQHAGGVPEHKLVMEKMLGRSLKRGESVYHKNGKRDDNNPQLQILWVIIITLAVLVVKHI